jgi:endonuclease G
MFDPTLALTASTRWRTSFAGPSALESLQPKTVTETDQQRRDRLTRLSTIASRERAKALALAADASPRAAASQSDVIKTIGLERVIGSRDLLDINFLELAIGVSRAVGRLHGPGEFATGFLVGPRLLMTNHHVFGDVKAALDWILELEYQDNSSGELLPVHRFKIDPGYFFYTDATLDFTLTGVGALSDKQKPLTAYPWVKLTGDPGRTEVGDPVNIIQHPSGGLKQIAFRQNKIISVTMAQPDFLCYSTDTEPGSSGSPCFNDQWELVAVHHSGVGKTDAAGNLLKKDGQVWKEGDDPEDINWIGNEGARVSAVVKNLHNASLTRGPRALLDEALSLNAPNAIELARSNMPGTYATGPTSPQLVPDGKPGKPGGSGNSGPAGRGRSARIEIPLVITVSLGDESFSGTLDTAAPVQPRDGETVPDSTLEKVVIDQDWAARHGFDRKFLGVTVEMPGLTDEQLQTTAQVSEDFQNGSGRYKPYELCYWNYSVLMNKRYRTAWFSAANVDGDNRFKLPPRQGDKWFVDSRMRPDEQISQDAFEKGIDRGHLTRREDAAWGDSALDATKSTNDTFHFTNCSLQASPFNRGKDRWQGLEQFLLEKHAKPELRRMNVVTGPVFNKKDPSYRNSKMNYSVPCPLQFWKICVLIRKDGSLSATGFILGQQDIADLQGFEAFDVGAAQITLAQLEQKTGLDFGSLKDVDHFAQTHDVGELEKLVAGGKQRLIRSFDDIVV